MRRSARARTSTRGCSPAGCGFHSAARSRYRRRRHPAPDRCRYRRLPRRTCLRGRRGRASCSSRARAATSSPCGSPASTRSALAKSLPTAFSGPSPTPRPGSSKARRASSRTEQWVRSPGAPPGRRVKFTRKDYARIIRVEEGLRWHVLLVQSNRVSDREALQIAALAADKALVLSERVNEKAGEKANELREVVTQVLGTLASKEYVDQRIDAVQQGDLTGVDRTRLLRSQIATVVVAVAAILIARWP